MPNWEFGPEDRPSQPDYNPPAPPSPSAYSAPSAPVSPLPAPSAGLISVGELFAKSWQILVSRFWVLLGIIIIPLIASILLRIFGAILAVVGMGLFLKSELNPLAIILPAVGVFLVFLVLSWILAVWPAVSLVYAIKGRERKLGFVGAFKLGWHKIISYWWVSLLAGLVVAGGLILLVIPGIIFAVMFGFATFVLVVENIGGLNALMRSKQLVSGNWWGVFGRGLLMIILVIIVSVIFGVIFKNSILANIISSIVYLIMSIFVSIYFFLMYEDLARMKAGVVFDDTAKRGKGFFIFAAILPLLAIPVILVMIFIGSVNKAKVNAKDVAVIAHMDSMRAAAELYYDMNGSSYTGMSCMVNSDFVSICNSGNYGGQKPVIYSGPKAYCAYSKLSSGKYYCIDSLGNSGETSILPSGFGYCNGITFTCP